MGEYYCYKSKQERNKKKDDPYNRKTDEVLLRPEDMKFCFKGGEIVENEDYKPDEYMQRVYAEIREGYARLKKSEEESAIEAIEIETTSETEDEVQSEPQEEYRNFADELPEYIQSMPYGKLLKKFPGGIEEALEFVRAEKEQTENDVNVHYNSPEPEKFGAKAFTKGDEIHIAPGEEDLLEHEIAHYYQQMEGKVSATGEINGEKVNTDQKLEQEADEFAENIDAYMPEIISAKSESKTTGVVQFGGGQSRPKEPTATAAEVEMYAALEESITQAKQIKDKKESSRISKIIKTLVTENIFRKSDSTYVDLSVIMQWLNPAQCETAKNCILRLKDCCDAKGIQTVLESANVNSLKSRVMLHEPKDTDGPMERSLRESFAEVFITRLVFMTDYIKSVYDKFGGEYWIQSTGSDPHHEGKHALFLVNKSTGERELVYKPHDMTADAAVVAHGEGAYAGKIDGWDIVGQGGMFADVNGLIRDAFIGRTEALRLNQERNSDALATMKINTGEHTEEYITKTKRMTPQKAQLYFFRAGILKVITNAMAVLDLHQDNIMPTATGPLIIDAEIDFFKYADSGLDSHALSDDKHEGRDTNSTFTIIKGGPDGKDIPSGKAFSSPHSPYYRKYQEGYNFMVAQMQDERQKARFADLYEAQLRNVGKVRIVPIETPMFAQFLHGAIMSPKAEASDYVEPQHRRQNYNRQHDASWLADQIESSLTNAVAPYIFNEVSLDKNALTKAIKKTFDNGTIIAMYIDMRDGGIYLDNDRIGEIQREGQPMTNDAIIGAMRNIFLDVIERRLAPI